MSKKELIQDLGAAFKEIDDIIAKYEKQLPVLKESLGNSDQYDELVRQLEDLRKRRNILESTHEMPKGNDPDGLLIPEEPESLSTYESDAAAIPFNATRFKRDMASNTNAKVVCLVHAVNGLGLIPDTQPDAQTISKEDIVAAIDELYENGYLTKYQLDGYGDIYKVSKRGAMAFSNSAARSFLRKYIVLNEVEYEDRSYNIDGSNSIKLRFLAHEVMKLKMESHNNDSFYPIDLLLASKYFLFKYMGQNSDDSICFIGILSENQDDFDMLEGMMENACFDIDHYVLCGYSKEYIDRLLKRLVSNENLEISYSNIGYKLYQDPVIYSMDTDKPIEFSEGEDTDRTYYEYLDGFLQDANLEDILTVNDDSLSYSESQKSKYSFGVKRFVKDIGGSYGDSMLYILLRIAETGFYKPDYMDAGDEDSYQELSAASEKLYNLGYFGKYSVENMDSFYILTKRGKKIFETRESAAFMRECSMDEKTALKPNIFEVENSNSAKLMLVMVDALDKVAKIDPNEIFDTHTEIIKNHYYILDFEGEEDSVLCNIAFISDDKEILLFFRDELLDHMDEMDDIGWLVISGLSEKQVKAFGDFVIDRYTLPLEKEKIYYTVYGKPGIYNLITGEELKMI